MKPSQFSEVERGWQKCTAGYHKKSCGDKESGVGLSQKGVELREKKRTGPRTDPWGTPY